jgi:hypothetical protein
MILFFFFLCGPAGRPPQSERPGDEKFSHLISLIVFTQSPSPNGLRSAGFNGRPDKPGYLGSVATREDGFAPGFFIISGFERSDQHGNRLPAGAYLQLAKQSAAHFGSHGQTRKIRAFERIL